MPRKKTFDKTAYDAAYNRENYRRISAFMRPSDYDALVKAADAAGMSKNGYILAAVREKIAREE